MKHVKKSVLLWYSPREMYDLVTAVADYPRFLPWCDQAEVIEQHDDGVTARIGLAYAGVQARLHHAQRARARRVGARQAGRRPVLAARRHLGLPAAGPAGQRRRRPARSSSTCAMPLPARRWRPCSARSSTGWPTPSSIPSSRAPKPCMAHAERCGMRIEVVVLPAARPHATASACTCPKARACRMQSPPAAFASATRWPKATCEVGIWGRKQPLQAPLRDRDRVELYRPAAGRPEGGAAPALQACQARERRRRRTPEDARQRQSLAMTSRARRASSARASSSRISRSPSALTRAMRWPLSSVASCSRARWQLSWRDGGRLLLVGLGARGSAPARRACGALRVRDPRRPWRAPPTRADAGAAGGHGLAHHDLGPLQDVLVGNVARRRDVADVDLAAAVAPFPLRLGRGRQPPGRPARPSSGPPAGGAG